MGQKSVNLYQHRCDNKNNFCLWIYCSVILFVFLVTFSEFQDRHFFPTKTVIGDDNDQEIDKIMYREDMNRMVYISC